MIGAFRQRFSQWWSLMPVYTYRREDGSTFDIRQRFLDEALDYCPTTGQPVSRVIQPAGIIFKGSGFYVNDSSKANKTAKANGNGGDKSASDKDKKAKASDKTADAKPAKAEKKAAAAASA